MSAFVLAVGLAHPAWAAPGDLDTTFGSNGKVTTDFTRFDDFGLGVAIQPDGKIVVAGGAGAGGPNAKFSVARYATDGTLDTTFGVGGRVTTDFTRLADVGASVVIQPDGKIVVAGTSGLGGLNTRLALARYAGDGTLDTTFGGDGRVTTDFAPQQDQGHAVAIQADARIVAAGTSGLGGPNPRFALARYNTDGTLDTTFGGDGRVTTDFTRRADLAFAADIQADGKIVAGGGSGLGGFAMARYNTDGTLDTTFGGDGTVTTDFTRYADIALAVAIQPDGMIVGAGGSGLGGPNRNFALARYGTDGTLDTTFGGDGKITTDISTEADIATALAIQADGKIVAAGAAGRSNPMIALTRYQSS